MASDDPRAHGAINEWEPYQNRDERRDGGWVRQFVNAVWPHDRAVHSTVRDQAMRQLTDDMRANRDMHAVVHRLEARYEDTLIECVRLRSEMAHYQQMAERAQRELTQYLMTQPPAPIRLGVVTDFRIPTAEEQARLNNMPIYQMGVDYGRGPAETAIMFRRQQELSYLQAHNEAAVLNAFALPKEFLKIDEQLSKKEPEPTGRIIDLES